MQPMSRGSDAANAVVPQSLVYDGVDFPELLSKRLGDLAFQLATEWEEEQQQRFEAKKREVDRLAAQIAALSPDKHLRSSWSEKHKNRPAMPGDVDAIDKSVELVPDDRSESLLDEHAVTDLTPLPGQPGWGADGPSRDSNDLRCNEARTTLLSSSMCSVPDSLHSCNGQQGTSVTQLQNCTDGVSERAAGSTRPNPNSFDVLHVWKKMAAGGVTSSHSMLGIHTDASTAKEFNMLFCAQLSEEEPKNKPKLSIFHRWIVMEPYSGRRTIWDLMAMALVLYDIIRIPLELLNPPETTFSSVMTWIVRLYWTFDLPLNFMTGYIRHDGRTEISARKIARRYLCTWAALDALLVCSDWMEVIVKEIVASEMDLARLGKTARINRIFRALRLVRLVRILRISESFRQLAASMVSEHFVVVFDIFMLVLLVIGLAHIIGCLWYGIGNWESRHGEERWIHTSGIEDNNLEYQYFVSLHWAVAQFSGGMDEFRPCNTEERIFAVFSLLTGFIVLSICVSGLTSAMTRLLLISSGPSRQLARVRQYLFEHHISSELTMRILRNSRFILKQQQRCMSENSIELIPLMSEPLRMELHYEIRSPQLAAHYFFNRYRQKCPFGMRSICHNACSDKSISAGDLIFTYGECPGQPQMLFVASGKLRYVQETGKVTTVEPGNWVSEAVLWTQWSHVGTLSALSECELLVLDATNFQDIVSRFRLVAFDPADYAREYVSRLNQSNTEDISDLEPDYKMSGSGHRLAFRSSAGGARDNSHQQAHLSLAIFRSMTTFSINRKGSAFSAVVAESEGTQEATDQQSVS